MSSTADSRAGKFVLVCCVCIIWQPARPRTLAILTPGKKKDKWEERVFTLTKKGLSWCAALQPTLEWHIPNPDANVVAQNASDRSCAL